MASLMPREAAFYKRTGTIYQSMKNRFRERKWKSGRNAGHVRVVGRQLPFDLNQFRDWLEFKLGGMDGTVKCRYCPAVLTALDCSVDHVHPVSQGGELELGNLDFACSRCQRFKGGLTERGFLELKDFLSFGIKGSNSSNLSVSDTLEIERRLCAGGGFFKSKAKSKRQSAGEPVLQEEIF